MMSEICHVISDPCYSLPASFLTKCLWPFTLFLFYFYIYSPLVPSHHLLGITIIYYLIVEENLQPLSLRVILGQLYNYLCNINKKIQLPRQATRNLLRFYLFLYLLFFFSQFKSLFNCVRNINFKDKNVKIRDLVSSYEENWNCLGS